MRLVHLSDLHLGYRQFQRTTPTGINQREADVASVFRSTIDRIIAIAPDVVVIAGDIFHNVRPSNPAIIHAFSQFSRLTQSLPDAVVVIVAGNHDTPRAVETGCILRLFAPLGVQVVDHEPRRLHFAGRDLSIFAVPELRGAFPSFDPDPSVRYNILVMHGEITGIIPQAIAESDRSSLSVAPDDLRAAQWSYVALGHYHVFRQLWPNTYYSGSIEYTSPNFWGEVAEERAARLPGKGMIEYDLDSGKRTFHPIASARPLVDLSIISARGMASSDVDDAIRANVARVSGGIEDKIVRQVVRDIPRHIARELDHKVLREYKRSALHFHLDARRPDPSRASASATPGRRPSLADTVRDKLWSRQLPSDIDRDMLVELGLQYLRQADDAETAALTTVSETE